MPKTKIPEIEVPYDVGGNQLRSKNYQTANMFKNEVFVDTLVFDQFTKSYSGAVGARFVKESDGTSVNFFMSELEKIMHKLVNGRVTGEFCFVKRGSKFGCRLLEKE